MTDTASRPMLAFASQHRSRHITAREADGQATDPGQGAWVQVASGPAQGAKGRIVERNGDHVTILTLVLGQRPLLLTVASAVCAPLEAAADPG